MKSRKDTRKSLTSPAKLLLVACGLVITGITIFLVLRSGKAIAPERHDIKQQDTNQTVRQTEPDIKTSVRNLQPLIDTWVASQSATYSIVVHDVANDMIIGSHLSDQSYFTASLYKLYVAYLALIDFQDGTQSPDAVILAGQTRKQCVDKMIRNSDSPCGEVMMADMGATNIDARLQKLGITQTSFAGLTTTAHDMNLILKLIAGKSHLNNTNTDFLRDAMLNQPQLYRNGLAKGAPGAKVFSRVGWNEAVNYHDVGIMQLADGREYLVSILSQDNGKSAPLAELSGKIYTELTR